MSPAVRRMGFRLLWEDSRSCRPVPPSASDFLDGLDALCGFHRSLTQSDRGPVVLNTEPKTRRFAEKLLDPRRTLPWIVVSTKDKAEKPSATYYDPRKLAMGTSGLARVFVLTASQTWILKGAVGDHLSVWGGSVRIYMPGIQRTDDTTCHPLVKPDGNPSGSKLEECELSLRNLVARASVGQYAFGDEWAPYNWFAEVDWSRILTGDESPLPPGQMRVETPESKPPSGTNVVKASTSAAPPAESPPGRFTNAIGTWASRMAARVRDTFELWWNPSAPGLAELRAELSETARKLRQAEKGNRELERSSDESREWADALEDENRELIDKISQRDQEIERLEARVSELRPLPKSWGELDGWCKRELQDRLMLHKRVKKGLHRAVHEKYENVEEAARGLRWLAEQYRDSRLHGRGTDLRGNVAGLNGLHNEPCGGDSYQVKWQGREYRVEWHLKHGNSLDARRCLRIYYFWDQTIGQVVVAHMPTHRGAPDRSP